MTVRFLVGKIVPDFPVRLRGTDGIYEEKLAGVIYDSPDSIYDKIEVIDWTFYREFLLIDT